jgi:serine/threonine protein kinase
MGTTTFGRYEVTAKLGEGAMGTVYQARDSALGRTVALKVVSAEAGGEGDLFPRFLREGEAVGRLSHPNIVTVYDVGVSGSFFYMAMELLDGQDLRRLLEQQAAPPMTDRLRIIGEICAGLGHAHSKGVIHRDVKPANILLTSSGQVKLLDFGLARLAAQATITKRGQILGTPDYMSPEQASGREVTERTIRTTESASTS